MVGLGRGRMLAIVCGLAASVQASIASAAEITMLAQLPPLERAKLLLAILGIILLGFLLLIIIRLGAWFARRRLREKIRPSRMGPKNWAARRFFKKPADRVDGTRD